MSRTCATCGSVFDLGRPATQPPKAAASRHPAPGRLTPAAIEAMREAHVLEPGKWYEPFAFCGHCGHEWPCSTVVLLAELDRLRAECPDGDGR